MIKISDDIYIAAEQISEIGLTPNRDLIYIRTKRGEIHHTPIKHGIPAYKLLDALAKKIDEEFK